MPTHPPAPPASRLAALVAVLALALTACSDDAPEPEPLPSPTAGTSPTASESPDAAPTLPPEAEGTSKKAAIAFVKYAIDVLNYSGQTLKTSDLLRIQSADCGACASIARNLGEIRRKGGSIKGGEWEPVEILVLNSAEPGIQVQVLVKYGDQVMHRTDGDKAAKFKGGQTLYVFSIQKRGDTFALSEIREL